MESKVYSTGEAAKRVGISRATLQAWIAKGKFDPPETKSLGKVTVRLWSQSDLARLRDIKQKIYWKGQGRPKRKNR
jgi:DNA-binding transcriptional MerR regulator